MTVELERYVFIGGPSHGESHYSEHEPDGKIVCGPAPIGWHDDNPFGQYRHFYRLTREIAEGMPVYEYVGESHPGH